MVPFANEPVSAGVNTATVAIAILHGWSDY